MPDSGSNPRRSEIEKLIDRNPKVDKAEFDETREMLEGLRKEGVPRRPYGIISPHERGRLRSGRRRSAN